MEGYIIFGLLFCVAIIIHRAGCFNLTLMHTNDVHAKFEEFNKYLSTCSKEESSEGKCFGGMARHVTITREIRNSTDNVIYLNAGDFFQGTLWYTYYQGAATAYFTGKLGIDAACFGNHEFDDGVEVLSEYLKNITFPIVTCNLDSSNEPFLKDLYQPSILFSVGGEQIGVVGYVTTTTSKLISPDYVKNLVFNDGIECIRREVDDFLSAGVNKIFVVGHGGFLLDQKIAREVEGIDVIVGGHSNTFLYTGEPPSNEDPVGDYPFVVEQDNGAKVLVVQAYGYGKYMGHLQLTFDEDGAVTSYSGNPILLDKSVVQDPKTLTEVVEWHRPLDSWTTTPIAKSHVSFTGTKEECRIKECNIGNLLTDAIFHSYIVTQEIRGDDWTDIAIAVWNAGSIRGSIQQGSVTAGTIFEAFPFRNEIIAFRIQGVYIWEMFQHAVAEIDMTDLKGAFLQVAGVKVEYNLQKPSSQRVMKVQVRCADCTVPRYEDLDVDKMYGMLTSAFIFNTGDGYTMLKGNATNVLPIGEVAADVVVDYMMKFSPIITGEEGRITVISNEVHACTSHGSIFGEDNNVFILLSLLCLLLK